MRPQLKVSFDRLVKPKIEPKIAHAKGMSPSVDDMRGGEYERG